MQRQQAVDVDVDEARSSARSSATSLGGPRERRRRRRACRRLREGGDRRRRPSSTIIVSSSSTRVRDRHVVDDESRDLDPVLRGGARLWLRLRRRAVRTRPSMVSQVLSGVRGCEHERHLGSSSLRAHVERALAGERVEEAVERDPGRAARSAPRRRRGRPHPRCGRATPCVPPNESAATASAGTCGEELGLVAACPPPPGVWTPIVSEHAVVLGGDARPRAESRPRSSFVATPPARATAPRSLVSRGVSTQPRASASSGSAPMPVGERVDVARACRASRAAASRRRDRPASRRAPPSPSISARDELPLALREERVELGLARRAA